MNILSYCAGAALLAIAALGSSAGAGQALVVGVGEAYAGIQQAVDAASPGDVIVVRPGNYAPISILQKGITITSDGSGTRPKVRGVFIGGIVAAQSVTLRGLDLFATGLGGVALPLAIQLNLGPIVIEDCSVGADALTSVHFLGATQVTNCARVLFVRCDLHGRPRVVEPLTGQSASATPALRCVDANVSIYDGEVVGGSGSFAHASLFGIVFASNGEGALNAIDSTLLLAGTQVVGGAGGDGEFGAPQSAHPGCLDGASGGVGLTATNTLVRTYDTVIAGGAAGVPGSGCPTTGQPGAATSLTSTTVLTYAESMRSLELTSPCSEGTACAMTLRGAAGEPAVMLFAATPGLAYVNALKGTLICAFPLQSFFVGMLPASGELTVGYTVAVGTLAPGLEGLPVYVQFDTPGDLGTGVLAAPSTLILLQAGVL